MSTFEPKITRLQPVTSVQTRLKAGRELAKDGRRDEALVEFEAAVRLDPNSKMARLAVGGVKARQKRYDEASKEYREVLRIDPLNFQGHLRLARVYLAKKENEKALEFANGALGIDPKSPDAMLMVGTLLMAGGDYPGARAQFTKAVQINPRLVRARLHMSYLLKRLGEVDEAIAQVTAAMRIEPENAKVHSVLGRLHLFRNDYVGASEAFQKAIALDPDNHTEAFLGLAEAFVKSGKLEQAEEALRRCPEHLESRPRIHKLWGDVHETRGLYRDAVEEYRAFAVLAAGESADPPAGPVTSDPETADTQAWKELAASLRKASDLDREQRKLEQIESLPGED